MAGDKGDQREFGDTHAAPRAAELGRDRDQERSRSAGAPGGTIVRALPEDAATGVELAPKRGPGRPAGSTNLRDNAVAQALVDSYGMPLEADVAIGNADIGGLVTLLRTIASDRGLKLGMTLGDVVRWQADCRRNAMPYLMGKRAQVDKDGQPVPPVVLGLGRYAEPGAGAPGSSIEDRLAARAAAEQNQGVIDVEAGKSHDGKSHDDASG